MDVQQHFSALMDRQFDDAAIYFGGRQFSWAQLGRAASDIARTIGAAALVPNSKIAWIARNEPHCVAAAMAVLATGHCLSPVNGFAPSQRQAADILALRPGAVLGSPDDLTGPVLDAAQEVGALALAVAMDGPVEARSAYAPRAGGAADDEPILLERMSSGTTGTPKRIPVSRSALHQALTASLGAEVGAGATPPRSPAILALPFAHSAGVWALVMTLFEGRPLVLLDRFRVDQWVNAIGRFRIKVTQAVPSMIEMLLQSDTPRDALASLICLRVGTAPLDSASKQHFEERFGVPILQDYGASEFTGGVAGWTMDDHRCWGAAKPRSVGRIKADIEARIVEGDGDMPVPNGSIGTLMLKSARFGGQWVRTTDLAAIDDDGFLYLHGRTDEAIIRGGFKILPEKIAEVIRQHDHVRDAIVIGVRDSRLGQRPIAIIETGGDRVADTADIESFLRDRLLPYEVPSAIELVETLPRTISLKIDRPATKAMFATRYQF